MRPSPEPRSSTVSSGLTCASSNIRSTLDSGVVTTATSSRGGWDGSGCCVSPSRTTSRSPSTQNSTQVRQDKRRKKRIESPVQIGLWYRMRLEFDPFDTPAQHKDATHIACAARNRKLKIIHAPEGQPAVLVAPKPELAQIHALIQQLHLHVLAFAPRRRVRQLSGLQRAPYVSDSQAQYH